mmetsp:Transcript_12741/g.27778  ORF Transcript_12741/g.27778 Transcript_12741/m.27778 type:complete len:108 (-) Transcript_12741:145-468(-)
MGLPIRFDICSYSATPATLALHTYFIAPARLGRGEKFMSTKAIRFLLSAIFVRSLETKIVCTAILSTLALPPTRRGCSFKQLEQKNEAHLVELGVQFTSAMYSLQAT